MPNLRSEKGATLVELLAALVLFTFVGAVAYTFLINSFLFQERSEERVDLVQESNLLAAELTRLHETGSSVYLDEDGHLYENSSSGRQLLAQDVVTTAFAFNGEPLPRESTLNLNRQRYEFNTELQSGSYNHSLQFTSNRVAPYTFVPEGGGWNEDETEEEEPPPTPEDIEFPDEDNLGEERSFREPDCTWYGDTNHRGNLIATWETCIYNENIDGNLHFTDSGTVMNSSEGVYLTVTNGSLFAERSFLMQDRSFLDVSDAFYTGGDTTLQSNSKATIGGVSVIKGALSLQENASLQTSSLNTAGNLQIFGFSRVDVSGITSVEREFKMQESAVLQTDALTVTGLTRFTGNPLLNVSNDAIFSNGLNTDNSPAIFIGGNMTVNGPARLQADGSPQLIEVGSNAFFNGNLNYQQSVHISVVGDMLVTGDIGSQTRGDAGRLCVQGDLQVDGEIYAPITVSTNASSCDGISAGEIRVLGNLNQ